MTFYSILQNSKFITVGHMIVTGEVKVVLLFIKTYSLNSCSPNFHNRASLLVFVFLAALDELILHLQLGLLIYFIEEKYRYPNKEG